MSYPIVWKGSPNYTAGRGGHQPIAIVNHRMVGWLAGTDTTFSDPANQVSAHFGIGVNKTTGKIEIHQYVDLSDSAWGNGNYDPTGGWPLIKKRTDGSVINPNYYTVSIEHEDGAETNQGLVSEECRRASVWLSSIILTGSPLLVRASGVRVHSDSTVTALGNIVPGAETYIDHKRISGIRKPYCWRPWLSDPGFVPTYKPQMLADILEMNMTLDEVMALLQQKIDQLEAERDAAIAAKTQAETERNSALNKLQVAKNRAAEIQAL